MKLKTIIPIISCILILLSSFSKSKYSWELLTALTDLNRCQIHYIKEDLTKLLIKAKDTINYYHDLQLIILYSEKKHNELNANTFYIINHGFKRKVTIDLLYAEIENTGKKIKNIPNTKQFTSFINWHYENDTIYCNSYEPILLTLPIGYYNKFK